MFGPPEENELPEKLFQTKTYLRMGPDGKPQVIRVEPMITANQTFVPGVVRIYVDKQQTPTIFEREAAYIMLKSTNCEPIEEIMRHKHLMRN